MTTELAQLTVTGISRTEQLDLLDHLPPGAAEVQAPALPPGELGEPVTMLVLVSITVLTLSGVAAWLSAHGKDVKMSFGIKLPGVEGSFAFEARSGETGDDLRGRLEAQGVPVPAA